MQALAALVALLAIGFGFAAGGILGTLTGLVATVGVGSGLAIALAEVGTDVAAGGAVRTGQRIGGVLAAAGCLAGVLQGGWSLGWLWGFGGYVVGGIAAVVLVGALGAFRGDTAAASRDVGTVSVTFGPNTDHQVTVLREPFAPVSLDGPLLDTALFLYYTAKALHALGPDASAKQLRQHVASATLTLKLDEFEPFTSVIDQSGLCIGRLRAGRVGDLSMQTTFKVPLTLTNAYIFDSVLILFSHAVEHQPTADHRRSLASAAEALEDYYRTIADSTSLKALKEAPAAAFDQYRHRLSAVDLSHPTRQPPA